MRGTVDLRCTVLEEVRAGRESLGDASDQLKLSYRQVRRLWKRYVEEGPRGIEHRNKGRQSNRSYEGAFKDWVLSQYAGPYSGLGPTEFCKTLNAQGIDVDHETLRRWLISRGLWTGQRTRIDARQEVGQAGGFGRCLVYFVVQGQWLKNDPSICSLHLLQDDDTGVTLAAIEHDKSLSVPMRLLWAWLDRFGIPVSLCCQKSLITDKRIHLTLEQEFMGVEQRTCFAQACDKLGIDILPLNPAKSKCITRRMERETETVKKKLEETRKEFIVETDIFLRCGRTAPLNAYSADETRGPDDYHAPILDGTDLRNIFCYSMECEISAESLPEPVKCSHSLISFGRVKTDRKRKVTVAKWLDGSIHFFCDGVELPSKSVPVGLLEQVAI